MKPLRLGILAGSMLFAACASTVSTPPSDAPVAPAGSTPVPEDIQAAEAELRREILPTLSVREAGGRAARLGLSCYVCWNWIPANVVMVCSSLYCSRSCPASVKSGWWIELDARRSNQLTVTATRDSLRRDADMCESSAARGFVEIIVEDSGMKYSGQVLGVVPDGEGTGTWKDGTTYEGRWANGQPEGEGKMTIRDGELRIGNWKNGQLNGKGRQAWPDGSSFEGDFVNGKPHGEGTQRLKDGTEYSGNFVDGLKGGKGDATYPNGDRYSGGWQRDVRHGPGLFFSRKNGVRYAGEWVNGRLTGVGFVIFKDNRVFEGQFLDGKGKGTCRSPERPTPVPCEIKLPR